MDDTKQKILEEIKKIKKEYDKKLSELIEERNYILKRYRIFLENKKNAHE